MTLNVARTWAITLFDASGLDQCNNGKGEARAVAEKSVFHAWRIRILVSVARADRDTLLNLLDCLVDYLDGVDPVTAFVVRGLHELIARPIQGIERPFHVTLVGMGVLDQRNCGDDESEDLAEKSGSHKKFQSLPRKNAMETCERARKFVYARFAVGSNAGQPRR